MFGVYYLAYFSTVQVVIFEVKIHEWIWFEDVPWNLILHNWMRALAKMTKWVHSLLRLVDYLYWLLTYTQLYTILPLINLQIGNYLFIIHIKKPFAIHTSRVFLQYSPKCTLFNETMAMEDVRRVTDLPTFQNCIQYDSAQIFFSVRFWSFQ